MARIRRDTKLKIVGWIEVKRGILNAGTGTLANVNVSKNNVIRIGVDKGRTHK